MTIDRFASPAALHAVMNEKFASVINMLNAWPEDCQPGGRWISASELLDRANGEGEPKLRAALRDLVGDVMNVETVSRVLTELAAHPLPIADRVVRRGDEWSVESMAPKKRARSAPLRLHTVVSISVPVRYVEWLTDRARSRGVAIDEYVTTLIAEDMSEPDSDRPEQDRAWITMLKRWPGADLQTPAYWRTKDIIEYASQVGFEDFWEALRELCSGPVSTKKLGHAFRRRVGMWFGDRRLVSKKRGRGGFMLWRVASRDE